MVAARGWHSNVARVLLEGGADIDKKDSGGHSSVSWAVLKRLLELGQILLDNGAGVDNLAQGNRTPLCWAATKGLVEVVQMLLEKGANVEGMPGLQSVETRGWCKCYLTKERR